MSTRTLVTAEELGRMDPDILCELMEGEIIYLSPSKGRHGLVSGNFHRRIGNFADERRLGVTNIGELGYLLGRDPDTVVAPDVSFVSRERIAETGIPEDYWPFAPDLDVEVVFLSNIRREIARKVAAYLAAGSKMVWVAHSKARTVTVHLPGAEPRVLHEDDTLDGGEALPGFAVRVRDFFELDL